MKKLLLTGLLIGLFLTVNAQKNQQRLLDTKPQVIDDRAAIKNVLDTFSVLADKKDIKNQVLLFTENAVVDSRNAGQSGQSLIGRKAIGEAFSSYLANFEVVFHMNGQQIINIDGERATGLSYCQVILVGDENGKKMKTSMWVYYNDDFVKQGGKWMISHRISNFVHREHTAIPE